MPRPGFYNDNEYRAYPFIYKTTAPVTPLPDRCIVDCGIIMGLDSQFEFGVHTVWLASMSRTATTAQFIRETDAPGVHSTLVFTRDLDATEWLTEYDEGIPGDPDCATEPAWEGFLVTGVLTELIDAIPEDTTITFASTDYVLESTRVQSLVKSYLRSVSVGNYSRVLAAPPPECGGSDVLADRYVIPHRTCMQGNLRFVPGYNCEITQVDRRNEIVVGPNIGAVPADEETCGEIPLFDGEEPPPGSQLLSGGPTCAEIGFTINGINDNGVVKIIGGPGVLVLANPEDPHGILIERLDNVLTAECG